MTVAAPGVRIPTLTGAGQVSYQFSGTSAATPIVAGIVALAVAWARSDSDAALWVRAELLELLRGEDSRPGTQLDPSQFFGRVVERIQG